MTKMDWARAKIPDPGAVRQVPDVKQPEKWVSPAEQQKRRKEKAKEEKERKERAHLMTMYNLLERSAKAAKKKRRNGQKLTILEAGSIEAFNDVRRKLGF